MNRLLFRTFLGFFFITLMTSCNNEDDIDSNTEMPELCWVEGNYTGTFEKSTKIYHDGNFTTPETTYFSKKNCNVKVTLNSDNTLTILIRGEYNSTLQNKSFSVSEDSHIIKCDCYTFDKDAQSMRYYESGSNYFNDGWSMQWTYTLFEAYKDF
ncbi:MAG: hypothetical protein PUB55_07635 [Bacteroidales bacterium]|nr:hypothetical protein [Bacteroidales bacterium]